MSSTRHCVFDFSFAIPNIYNMLITYFRSLRGTHPTRDYPNVVPESAHSDVNRGASVFYEYSAIPIKSKASIAMPRAL